MKHVLTILLTYVVGCAVEAGNPVEETGGTVKVSIAANEESGLSLTEGTGQFTLNLESIQLIGYDDDGDISATLTPVVSEVDLFSSNEAIELASESVASGTYETIIIQLKQDKPFHYAPDGVNEEDVFFSDDSHRSFYISQEIVVEDGGGESIVIDIDRISSIETVDTRKVFKPKIRSFRKKHVFDYTGQVDREDGRLVCAYLYDPFKAPPPPRPDGRRSGRQPPPPPPPPPGVDGKMPIEFATKEEVLLDELPRCPNSFARVKITDGGNFYFPRLKPGSYIFRAFYVDGTFDDVAEDVRLTAEESENTL